MRRSWILAGLAATVFFALPLPAQVQPDAPPVSQLPQNSTPPPASSNQPNHSQQTPASISGTVVDATGAAIAGARVVLMREGQSPAQEVTTGQDGIFSFTSLAPGPYTLTISATGFNAQTLPGTLRSGEVDADPPITLALAANVTEVQVVAPRAEIAEGEIKAQEKQLVLGFVPNFYVTYVPDAVPLNARQKFELAWKSTTNPVTILLAGAAAGIEQADNAFSGYGQGAPGYFRRFGASYGDTVTGTFIGSAILPSLLKQDPRYFYKGTGTARSRLLYALANAVICKGDNKRWQPNYSAIGGSFAAGGISNLYYPAAERGVQNTVENALIAIGESAAANVFQEFVVKKFTPSVSKRHPES